MNLSVYDKNIPGTFISTENPNFFWFLKEFVLTLFAQTSILKTNYRTHADRL